MRRMCLPSQDTRQAPPTGPCWARRQPRLALPPCPTHPLQLLLHQLDITDEGSIKRFASWAGSDLKSIDVLCNNAGKPRA